MFEYREVDVLRDPKLLLSLKGQYKTEINSGVLLVLDENCTTISFEELQQGKAFIGESVLINTLAQLASPAKNVYWLIAAVQFAMPDEPVNIFCW